MLIYFWVVLVISPAGFLEDLLGCSAICIICDPNHVVSILKCMCSQNNVINYFIHSFSSDTVNTDGSASVEKNNLVLLAQ